MREVERELFLSSSRIGHRTAVMLELLAEMDVNLDERVREGHVPWAADLVRVMTRASLENAAGMADKGRNTAELLTAFEIAFGHALASTLTAIFDYGGCKARERLSENFLGAVMDRSMRLVEATGAADLRELLR